MEYVGLKIILNELLFFTINIALRLTTMKNIILLFLLLSFSSVSIAAENQEACVKYQNDSGWSKGYSVVATIISGLDLNSAVGSFSRYESFATYAAVFWGEGQASIYKLPPLSMGSLSIFEQEVKDQEGRKWKIKKGNNFCY